MRRRVDETEEALDQARIVAYRDELTGVKSKHAYAEYRTQLERQIDAGVISELAIVVFDVNGLKHVNDTYGHKAGDDYIRSACTLICTLFKHSPVSRIGGDEFVAVLTGEDFNNREALLAEHDSIIESHVGTEKVVVVAGMCDFVPDGKETLRDTFVAADERMYERKHELKAMGAHDRA